MNIPALKGFLEIFLMTRKRKEDPQKHSLRNAEYYEANKERIKRRRRERYAATKKASND